MSSKGSIILENYNIIDKNTIKSKPKNKFFLFLRKALADFLSQTGIKYYNLSVNKDIPIYERLLWFLVIIISITSTIWMFNVSYNNFLRTPTVVSERPTRLPVTQLPFPAIGLCSQNRISRSALEEYSKFM